VDGIIIEAEKPGFPWVSRMGSLKKPGFSLIGQKFTGIID
jgi:hypothetical protein